MKLKPANALQRATIPHTSLLLCARWARVCNPRSSDRRVLRHSKCTYRKYGGKTMVRSQMKGTRRGVGYDVFILISKQHATLNYWKLIPINLHVHLSICLSAYLSIQMSTRLQLYIWTSLLCFCVCTSNPLNVCRLHVHMWQTEHTDEVTSIPCALMYLSPDGAVIERYSDQATVCIELRVENLPHQLEVSNDREGVSVPNIQIAVKIWCCE